MRKYARLLASYAAIAITAMVLYTPWLVGLTPSDPSVLRASLSVTCAIVLAGAFGASTYAYLRQPEYRLLEAAEVDDPDDVLPQLEGMSELPVIGSYASEAASQIDSMERRHARLERSIAAQFGSESLSHDKFMAVTDSAQRTLLRNCALLCNRIQAFDIESYQGLGHQQPAHTPLGKLTARLVKARRGLTSEQDAQDPATKPQGLAIYDEALADMREVIEANERLLLEMGKLEMELSDLDSDATSKDNARMLEEVQELLDQTKFYR